MVVGSRCAWIKQVGTILFIIVLCVVGRLVAKANIYHVYKIPNQVLNQVQVRNRMLYKNYRLTKDEKADMMLLMDNGELQLFAEENGFSNYLEAYIAYRGIDHSQQTKLTEEIEGGKK